MQVLMDLASRTINSFVEDRTAAIWLLEKSWVIPIDRVIERSFKTAIPPLW
jgi:hypothetical protein